MGIKNTNQYFRVATLKTYIKLEDMREIRGSITKLILHREKLINILENYNPSLISSETSIALPLKYLEDPIIKDPKSLLFSPNLSSNITSYEQTILETIGTDTNWFD